MTRAGQEDIPEQSLRDVFNDVSKYIRNISISLNAVLPELPDNPDVSRSPCPTYSHKNVPRRLVTWYPTGKYLDDVCRFSVENIVGT